MQTSQGAVSARQRKTGTQGRRRMKKLGKNSPTWCPKKYICGSQRQLFSKAWEPSWSHKHCGMSTLRAQSWPSTSHINGWLWMFITKVLLILYPSWLRPWPRVWRPNGQCSMTGCAQEEGQKNRQNKERRWLKRRKGHQRLCAKISLSCQW